MWRLNQRDERGATAALVAILITTSFLILGALVVSVGGWYSARGMDQNSADAAAVAVATTCLPQNGSTCTVTAADKYVTAGANGGLAGYVSFVCGTLPTGTTNDFATLGSTPDGQLRYALPCPTTPAGYPPGTGGCPAAPANGDPYINVAIRPGSATNTHNLFDSGSTPVSACAQATIGKVGGGQGLSMTISLCNWAAATGADPNTGDGGTFAPAPPYASWPPAGVTPYVGPVPAYGAIAGEQVLPLHGNNTGQCNGTQSGQQLAGGFGWLSDPNGNCQTTISAGNTYQTSTGNSADPACEALLLASWQNHTPVYFPVYSQFSLQGNNGTYVFKGWATFIVTGAFMHGGGPSFDLRSNVATQGSGVYCGGSYNTCLYGFFTQGLIPDPTLCVATQTCLGGTLIAKLTG